MGTVLGRTPKQRNPLKISRLQVAPKQSCATMSRMRAAKWVLVVYLAISAFSSSAFGSPKCLDAADEPHHRVIFENKEVRIFQLELARLQSTSVYCYAGPVLYFVPTDRRNYRI